MDTYGHQISVDNAWDATCGPHSLPPTIIPGVGMTKTVFTYSSMAVDTLLPLHR